MSVRTVEWDEVDGEDVGDMATSQKLEVALSAVPRFPPNWSVGQLVGQSKCS